MNYDLFTAGLQPECHCHIRTPRVNPSPQVNPAPPVLGGASILGPLPIRTFDTGATRDSDKTYDPSGFLSPAALHVFCQYMERHRLQKDGTLRDSDNWKKGMPIKEYYKSLWRHMMELSLRMDESGFRLTVYPKEMPSVEDSLCAIIFNAQGALLERLKGNE